MFVCLFQYFKDIVPLSSVICSKEKFAVILTFILLYIICVFFLALFFLFISGFEQFHYDVHWYNCLHFPYAWDYLSFLHLWVCFHQIWGILTITFSIIFSVGSPLWTKMLEVVLQLINSFLTFHLEYYLLLCLRANQSFLLQCLNLPLISISVFVISDIVVFISRSLIWFFFISSVFPLNFFNT